MLPSPKIVIFDMDGVLLNQEGTLMAIKQALASEKFEWDRETLKGMSPMDLLRLMESTDSTHKMTFMKGIYQKFAPYLPSRYKRMLYFKHIGQHFREYEKRFSKFYEDAAETIRFLHEKGILMGICTNADGKRTDYWLKRYGLDSIIKYKTSRDMKKQYGLKPSPGLLYGLLLEISKKEKVLIDRRHVYFVGDNVTDVKAAKNGNMKSIAVYSGNGLKADLEKAHPDYLIEKVSDIVNIEELFS